MHTQIDVVYDGEALRPSHPLDLWPHRHYSVTITEQTLDSVNPLSTGSHPVSAEDAERISIEHAWRIYDNRLKALLEPEYNGKVVAVDLETEDYEVAPRSLPAWKALKARHPYGQFVFLVVGPVSPDSLLTRRLNRTIPRKEAET
ncbi:MAG: hypothetical protein ACLQVD_03595 [Capsulimonadaceae bacterium]